MSSTNRGNIPPCGIANCNNRATHADPSGVGYCGVHKRDSLGPAVKGAPFDEWWAASSLGHERKDPAWDGIDEYGVWP